MAIGVETAMQRLLPDSSIRKLVRQIRTDCKPHNAPVKLLEQCTHIPEAATLLEEIRGEPVPAWKIALNKRRALLDAASPSPTCPRVAAARERLRELAG